MAPTPPAVERAPAVPTLHDDLVLSGEIHYFRLDATEWEDRLDAAVETGLNAVATYIPWLAHELPDGTFDLTGRTRPELDLGRFLDLCADRGLAVIARPGPFVMAELKHEGLPHSLFRDHPEIVPPAWDGHRPEQTVVDYLHPAYLAACRRWYEAVLPIVAARTTGQGGTVVGVQLDNEIGMLPWVTNSPDLSDSTIHDLVRSLVEQEGAEPVQARYGLDPADLAPWGDALRSPGEEIALALHRDLGRYTRAKYAAYVDRLAGWARELGIDTPFLVNIHGCWGGDARMFPLGVSQLYQTWEGRPDILPGTDYYIGDLTLAKLPGFWASNAFVAATTLADQPAGSLEFEVGSADYGEALDIAAGPEAAPLKLQMCLAQGNTFVNYYLLTGGRNPLLFEAVGDGNDRIAFTGERHGFAAPIDPEGRRAPGYALLRDSTLAVTDDAALLREARPETPPVTLGFVPDHYMTEYRYPGSAREERFVAELDRFRGSGPREIMTRALVLAGFAPDAVDLQAGPLDLDPGRVLALAPTPHLDEEIQQHLVDWVRAGGRLLLHGPVPDTDMLGRPATTLVDALGLTPGARIESSPTAFPSVVPADERLQMAEVRVGFAQPLTVPAGADVLATIAGTDEPCVARLTLGEGQVMVVAADIPCLLPVWSTLLDELGAAPTVRASSTVPGVVVVPTATPDGTRVVHVMNASPWDAEVTLERDGAPLLAAPLLVPARAGAWTVQRPGEAHATLAFAGAKGDVR
ncbi:beta-galactosidase [Oerskovia turbata]